VPAIAEVILSFVSSDGTVDTRGLSQDHTMVKATENDRCWLPSLFLIHLCCRLPLVSRIFKDITGMSQMHSFYRICLLH
jgi:hypothetical protein